MKHIGEWLSYSHLDKIALYQTLRLVSQNTWVKLDTDLKLRPLSSTYAKSVVSEGFTKLLSLIFVLFHLGVGLTFVKKT